jgi:hypothetical protein
MKRPGMRPGPWSGRRTVGAAVVICAAVSGLLSWRILQGDNPAANMLIPSRVDAAGARRLAEKVPFYPGSQQVGYKDTGWSQSSSQCHGRSAQVLLRGKVNVVWDVTQWYDRNLPPRGWQIFGGTDSRGAGPGSFVEHGYVSGRQSIGVWLPADSTAHAQKDVVGLTAWRIDYTIMDGDGQSAIWCALSQIGPLGA